MKQTFNDLTLDELVAKAVADSVDDGYLVEGIYRRACIYQDGLDDQESAIAEFEEVMETAADIDGADWAIYYSHADFAICYAKMGNLDRAEQFLRESENDIDKYGPSALRSYWGCVGRVEMEKGNFNNAAEYFEKLAQLNPYGNQQELARCYLGTGQPREAVTALERIINRYGSHRADRAAGSVTDHFWLGRAYEETESYVEANTQYETLLDIWKNADPGLELVKDAKERLAHLKDI